MKWNIANARQNFRQLLQDAQRAPQSIYKHDRFVAAVLDAESFAAFQAWRQSQRQSIGEALQDIQAICQEETYQLETGERRNRANPFT